MEGKISTNSIYFTPCLTQEHIIPQMCSSSKRSLFQEELKSNNITSTTDLSANADSDSDLGPMSPLALTDQSSCDSSPGRQFVSPLATPDKSLSIPLTNWSRVLKHYHDSTIMDTGAINQEIISDGEFIPETPMKSEENNELHMQIHMKSRPTTSLGLLCNSQVVPKSHRRNSLSEETNESLSPEIEKCCFKRGLRDDLNLFSNIKFKKSSEVSTAVPRAKAALFQDTTHGITDTDNCKLKRPAFTLTPRSFYGPSVEKICRPDVLIQKKPSQTDRKEVKYKKNHSLCNTSYHKSIKKYRGREINCKVWHGIKKQKHKQQSMIVKVAKSHKFFSNNNKLISIKENYQSQKKFLESSVMGEHMNEEPECKNEVSELKQAHATLNHAIKLQRAIKLKNSKFSDKKAVFEATTSDINDLSVDELDKKLLNQNYLNNILKALEEDWTDNDDTVESNKKISFDIFSSSKKPNIMLKNLSMSPGSELSSMTSYMNIKDLSEQSEQFGTEIKNQNCARMPAVNFFPLFSKNNLLKNDQGDNKTKKRKRNASSWQLSSKSGCTGNQYQIDAGQKMFGATLCCECKLVYLIGDPGDENAHLNYHNSFKFLKFPGWKNERVVYVDVCTFSRIIVVGTKDSGAHWKKVNEILLVVDRDLGLTDVKKVSYNKEKQVYLYIRDKAVLGILVAEYVENAFKIIPEFGDLNCCTSESTPVKCGISVVWTALGHRRQGIATKLVDVLRTTYYNGYVVSMEDLAFATPTPNGKKFAENYTNTQNFKVY